MGLENKPTQEIYATVVHITDRCNFGCKHCLEKRGPSDMSPEKFGEVLDWQKNLSSGEITIYGGEVRIHPHFRKIVEMAKRKDLRVEMYTNGFGMSSPEKIGQIINELSKMGVDTLAISTDKDHRDYAESKGIKIDYDFLEELFNLGTQKRMKKEIGIEGDIRIHSSGNGYYVIPVGNAGKYSWKRRFESGNWGHDKTLEMRTKNQLKNEYSHWSDIKDYSHPCYCPPARLMRRVGKSSDLGFKTSWTPHINTDMTVTTCPFDLIPQLGKIGDLSAEEMFRKLSVSLLYQVIGKEGPQGVARLVWNVNEDNLKKQFIERTPCGLCEDLSESNYIDLQRMMDIPKE